LTRYKATIVIHYEASDEDEASRRAHDMSLGATNGLLDGYDEVGFVRDVEYVRDPADHNETLFGEPYSGRL
jgi:hypothetical protein